MFRWRNDKNRVKAVFKLHFHVTQVLQPGVDSLVLSIVPGDIGKVTTRLEKALVRGGVCRWENPVYETVKFIQDPKTGKFSERVYYFVVSTGLSKGSSFGEVSVDFASYADATKLSSVSLPIKNSHSDAVLHVSIQRLQDNNDTREEEECEDAKLKPHDRSLRTYLSNGDIDGLSKSDSSEDVSAKESTNRVELSADRRTSSGSSEITLSSSDGSFGLDTPRELALQNTSILPNANGFLSDMSHASEPQKLAVNASPSLYDVHQRSHWDWSAGSEHGLSADDAIHGSQDALSGERSHQPSDMENEKLKAQVAALARQMEVSDLELQTLRKQIVKESKRGQELSKEAISLKEERDKLKVECGNLRSFHKRMDEAKAGNTSQLESVDLRTLVEEIKQELKYEKDLNTNLRLQLEKTQDSNAELVLAVQDLDEMLEQKNREICGLSNKNEQSKSSHDLERNLSNCEADDDEEQKELEELVKEHSNAKETHLLEQKILDLYGEIEMYRRDKDELEMQMEQLALDYEILKQENHDMAYKLEQSELQEQLNLQYECSSPHAVDDMETHIQSLENQLKKQSDEFSNSLATIKDLESQISRLVELEKQSETHVQSLENQLKKQSEEFSNSLATIKDLESQISRLEELEKQSETHIQSLENQLKKQSEEFSNSLASIKVLESQISILQEELEKQAQGFEADIDDVMREKVEQEQRAIRAEEALQKTRCKNANTAERLQEEFKRLSMQMASTFDANEKATMKAFTEASELRGHKRLLEGMLHKVKEELQSVKVDYEVKLNELSNKIDMMTVQIQEMMLEIEDKSKQLENQKTHEEQLSGDFSEKIQMLKAENGKLKAEISCLSAQVKQKEILRTDLELTKKSLEDSETLLHSKMVERNELVTTIALLKKEVEKSLDELNRMIHLKNEEEKVAGVLHSEIEALKAQCSDMKQSLIEDETEKEKLRTQVLELSGELKKKDDALTNMEKRYKDSNGCTQLSHGTKSIPENSKEMSNLKEKIQMLEDLIKSKETAMETSASSFLEKERELKSKIEELEDKVEEFNQSIALLEVVEDKSVPASNDTSGEVRSTADEHLDDTTRVAVSSFKSDIYLLENEAETSSMNHNSCDMPTELSSLKERNNSMETELKELQERYSEMSLKFAEVEGERQKLVMTVRSLKNARRSKNE
ncbi:uncharacterized protein LOC130710662 [Lotus japonicus]|uniref:uncharacterized protein LOC130710662 n=1 Tax=Lotus japonicus TaxID=34305 RepID=UPI002584C9BC|nr:uncharacterized protein LOC130710662 [Lotus japonicus]XP_057415985.1 uncharacterized protein LOC130710662 [Lotus japonicus]